MEKGTLKKRLYDGETCLGTWLFLPSPDIIEMVGCAKFDFAVIDMEHSAITLQDAVSMIRAAETRNLTPLLRVNAEASCVLRALDSGAHGIHFPHTETKEDIDKIVSYSKYYPVGERGLATTTKGGSYSLDDVAGHVVRENERSLIAISLESKESLDNLDQFTDSEQIDVIYVGPYDLSQSLGMPGQVDDPKVLKAMEEVIKKIRKKGKIAGSFARRPDRAKQLKGMGVNYLTCESDGSCIREAFERIQRDIFC